MKADAGRLVTLFLCGDVMTGRGIDQILPHPSDPQLYEACVSDARTYVALAEAVHGPIPRPVDFADIWGDGLAELQRVAPAARIINLETSVTRCDDAWPKGIHYRMHPANVGCLTAAGVDVCTLANNHVLDYGPAGVLETLETLRRAGLKTTGAGRTLAEALRPAVVEVAADCRVIVQGFGTESSGIAPSWAAAADRPGVAFLPELSADAAAAIAARLHDSKRPGDLVVVSLHWGSNWGYAVPPEHVRFAHRLIDGGVDLVHGHSSHHPRPLEVYRGRLILYGCGDLLNDYEGISGYEPYRDDLVLMYFATLEPASGRLVQLRLTPMQIRRMRLQRATAADARWLERRLTQVSRGFGAWVEAAEDGSLRLCWKGRSS